MDKNFREIASEWDHAHRYTPAPRHRRNIILSLLKNLQFKECLDAGCAQPYLLQAIMRKFSVKGYGCDISTKVINENCKRVSNCEFRVLDLEKETWPEQRQFELVVSSEVLEHISDWQSAINNIAKMASHYLLITVPSGRIRKIDKMVGHYRHFEGGELVSQLASQGFKCKRIIRHGFPVHSLYKRMINGVAPDQIYRLFDNGKKYSFAKKMVSHLLYAAFYLNYLFSRGDQLFILAERQQ